MGGPIQQARPHNAPLTVSPLICTYFEIELHVEHIKGSDNVIADAVSRNLLQVLHQEAPQLDPLPTAIPPALWELLVISRLDWLSSHWSRLWKEYLRQSSSIHLEDLQDSSSGLLGLLSLGADITSSSL